MAEFQENNLTARKNMIRRVIEILREEGIKSFIRKSSAYMVKKLSFFVLPYFLLKIKLLNRNYTLAEAFDFAFNGCGGLIRPMQVQSEILELLNIVDGMKPKTILEIGTANGRTLFLLSRVVHKNATIISVDLPSGRFGGGYPKWKEFLYKSFALPGQKLYLLRADSHKIETLKEVKSILDGRKVDFLFIDGDHTYEGVKRDFEMYSNLVERVIALHDITHHPYVPDCHVEIFWKEIKQVYRTKEIISSPKQTCAGIGIIFT